MILPRLIDTDQIDQVICAELPDSNHNPKLYEIITKAQLHEPSGLAKPDALMEDGTKIIGRITSNKLLMRLLKTDLRGIVVEMVLHSRNQTLLMSFLIETSYRTKSLTVTLMLKNALH